MKKFIVDYYAWIPSYGDFDGDSMVIEASSESAAMEHFNKLVKFVKSVSCKELDADCNVPDCFVVKSGL